MTKEHSETLMSRRKFGVHLLGAGAVGAIILAPIETPASGKAGRSQSRRRIVGRFGDVAALALHWDRGPEFVRELSQATWFRHPGEPRETVGLPRSTWHSDRHIVAALRAHQRIRLLYLAYVGREPTPNEAAGCFAAILDMAPTRVSRSSLLRVSTAHAQLVITHEIPAIELTPIFVMEPGRLATDIALGGLISNQGWAALMRMYTQHLAQQAAINQANNEALRILMEAERLRAEANAQAQQVAADALLQMRLQQEEDAILNNIWQGFYEGASAQAVINKMREEGQSEATTMAILAALGAAFGLFASSGEVRKAAIALWQQFANAVRLGQIGIAITMGSMFLTVTFAMTTMVLVGVAALAVLVYFMIPAMPGHTAWPLPDGYTEATRPYSEFQLIELPERTAPEATIEPEPEPAPITSTNECMQWDLQCQSGVGANGSYDPNTYVDPYGYNAGAMSGG